MAVRPQSIQRLGLAGLTACLLAAPARATVVLPAELGDLAREAQAIVHGRVVDTRAVWEDGRRRVDTLVTIEVEDYLKGHFGDTVTVRVPGGQIGRYRSLMIGAPVFDPGDEVVLFLNASGPSLPYVLGLSQGVFRVIDDPTTGGRLVIPPPVMAGVTVAPVRRGDASRRPMPLAAFSAEVRRLAAGGAR